jgi:hypothetical protein
MRNLRRWILVRTLKIPSQFGGALTPGGQGSAVPVHETGGWRRSACGPDPHRGAGTSHRLIGDLQAQQETGAAIRAAAKQLSPIRPVSREMPHGGHPISQAFQSRI